MKKAYIAPELFITDLRAEQMLAVSVGVSDKETDADNSWSQHKGWSSENWAETSEEMFEE